MVGRSLPLALLCLWVKYRERRSVDYGDEGFWDTRLAVGVGLRVGLSSCEQVYELYVCRASNPQMAQAGVRRRHEDSRAGRARPERVLPEGMNQARCWAYHESSHEESHGIGPAPIMCRTPAGSIKATRRIPGFLHNGQHIDLSATLCG